MQDSDLLYYEPVFTGDGSEGNPYLFDFENYTLSYSFNSTTVGIHVENITKYLVIRNLKLRNTNTSVRGTGIEIYANNVILDNISIDNTLIGFQLEGDDLHLNYSVVKSRDFGIKALNCNSLNITSTNITGATYGAFFQSCNQTIVSNNFVSSGVHGIQMYFCINFKIEGNIISQNSGKGLFIVETPPKSGSVNYVFRNIFYQNEIQAQIVTDEINTVFYNEEERIGNYWSDWRRWGKYTIQKDVYDLYPLGQNLEPASQYPFKFWFWIFAPIIVGFGTVAYFFYWKLVLQPTKQ